MSRARWQVAIATLDYLLATYYLILALTGASMMYFIASACWTVTAVLMTRTARNNARKLPSEKREVKRLQPRLRDAELADSIMRTDDYCGTDYFRNIYASRHPEKLRVRDFQTDKGRTMAGDIMAYEVHLEVTAERYENKQLRYTQSLRIEPKLPEPPATPAPSKKDWRKGSVAENKIVVCFACGGKGRVYTNIDFDLGDCQACNGTGSTRIVVEKRQKQDGFHPAQESVHVLDEELDRLNAKLSDHIGLYDPSFWYEMQRTIERKRPAFEAEVKQRAETELIPFLDRNVVALCDCPKGHAGIHLLDSIESDPARVLRTCTEEGCGVQWRERA